MLEGTSRKTRKEIDDKYYLLHKTEKNARSIKWRKEHPAKAKVIAQRYVANNLDRIKNMNISYGYRLKIKAFELMGNCCIGCGNNDFRVLQLDHIKGGGYQDKAHKGYRKFKFIIDNLKEAKKKYQLMCANCNWIKRWDNKEFKHSPTYQHPLS